MGQSPEFWVELLPKLVCRVIERPPKVQRQVGKGIRNGWIEGMITNCRANDCRATHKQTPAAYRIRPPGRCEQAFPKQWPGLPPRSVADGPDQGNSRRKSCR